jgi:formylglycine-generating enzyme
MLPEQYQWIAVQFEPEGDPWQLYEIARLLEAEGNLEGAATVYDRAYGLDQAVEAICEGRQRVLDQLAVVVNDIRFRYIPGGVSLMGNPEGETDERPWHPVWLTPYWLSETPISWATYCRLMDWEPPPVGWPRDSGASAHGFDTARFRLDAGNRIRLQYCEDHTTRAQDWHSHDQRGRWQSGGQIQTAQEVFGSPPRDDPAAPWTYDLKPMVAVAWQEAEELANRLSFNRVRYSLPTEAQWEKAARGGLIGARHAWGNDPPTHDRCDFERFNQISILPMTTFPPNGYGLSAVNGCVWEWTRDWYDRDYYRFSPDQDPQGPAEGEEKVLRGGSWSDCGDVVTVTFRMSRASSSWRTGEGGGQYTPNIGFRLCRTLVDNG